MMESTYSFVRIQVAESKLMILFDSIEKKSQRESNSKRKCDFFAKLCIDANVSLIDADNE